MKLTKQYKNHLYARTSFFTHPKYQSDEVDVSKVVNSILDNQVIQPISIDLPEYNPVSMKKLSKAKRKELKREWKRKVAQLNQVWIQQMLEEDKSFIEKMTLFWHGHFACDTSKNPYTTIHLNNILRKYALGNFKDLLLAVSQSAGMISYLHLKQNKKKKPNEDFARELCELFTLGRNVDYTENDVKEIARAFTGWTISPMGKFLFNEKQHDAGLKTIFGQTGNFKGEDVLKLITENPNTAKFIATKLYRFFVVDRIDDDNINELAAILYQSDYDIKQTMKHLFSAKWFYQAEGQIIKSPIDLLVGIGKTFDLKYDRANQLIKYQKYLGQILFKPPNVAGWPGGRNWIDASRLAFRLRFGSLILNKGSFQIDTGADLDERSENKVNSKFTRFYEEVHWQSFSENIQEQAIYDVLIRTKNPVLKEQFKGSEKAVIVKLISTPDYQLT